MAEEDNQMQHDDFEKNQDSPAADEWIMNVSKAQRRRDRQQLGQITPAAAAFLAPGRETKTPKDKTSTISSPTAKWTQPGQARTV
ncbi:hypothetical protein HPB48_019552 [Haemaphysalis longicornis]|uniref:Uncharacterized protein n=1 Tax=Haemaphysalis longicornis TaxID=44386 RepID=A0A9J6FRF1_HAELO|nr:hypothetical protein HPB48_019552 [Haemaphysalis longicornis]